MVLVRASRYFAPNHAKIECFGDKLSADIISETIKINKQFKGFWKARATPTTAL